MAHQVLSGIKAAMAETVKVGRSTRHRPGDPEPSSLSSCHPQEPCMQAIAEAVGQDRVARVVHRFYARVRLHPTLKTPFEQVHDWPEHEAVLTHFWWVSLGGQRYLSYDYAVARKHMAAGFTPELLVDWLTLFREVVNSELSPELATGWIARAEVIGESLVHMHGVQTRGGVINPGLFKPAKSLED